MNDENKHVSLRATYELDQQFDSSRFMKMRLRVCHTGLNRNGTIFTLEGFEKARNSLANIPILANVLFDEDGKPKFGAHDMTIVEDESGETRLLYQETPIGLIPEKCNYTIEEAHGRQYVCVDGYIWRDYANYAEDIIKSEKTIPLSMEIHINDYTYDDHFGEYLVNDYVYRGVTFLGYDVAPAMAGAQAKVNAEYQSTAFFEKMQFALQSELDAIPTIDEPKEAKTMSEIENNTVETSEVQTPEDAELNTAEEVVEEQPEAAEEPKTENTTEEEPNKQFALLSNVVDQIRGALNEFTMDFEGAQFPKYIFEDIDTSKQLVYVYSIENGNYYAAPYAVEGDTVSLVANFRRQVLSFRDFDEGQDTEIQGENHYAVPLSKFKELKTFYDQAQTELEELRKFQASTLAAQKEEQINAVLEQFTDLAGNEEFEALKSKAAEYSVEDFEKECFAIRGKSVKPQKSEKFKYNKTSTTGGVHFALPPMSEGQTSSSRIGDMIKHYVKKG